MNRPTHSDLFLAAALVSLSACPSDDSGGDGPAETGAVATDTGMGMTEDTSVSDDSTGSVADSSEGGSEAEGSSGEPPVLPEFDCAGVTGVHDGHIVIEAPGDLAQLDGIAEVTRTLVIDSTTLTDLDALGCVTTVGESLQIFGNASLTNVDGLVNVTSIGESFIFGENNAIVDFDGLQQLPSVPTVSITRNNGMERISGFHSLTEISDNITVRDNDTLTNIDGLKGLQVVGGTLAITANPMLCLSSVDCVGDGIVMPAVPPPDWTTQANDPDC